MENIIEQSLNQLYPVNIMGVEVVTPGMYRCFSEDKTYYARISNYKSYEHQYEELSWMEYLSQHGVGVATVVRSNNQQLIEKIKLEQEINTVLFEAAPGIHMPKQQWDESVFKKLGQEIGKMHRLSKHYTAHYPINYLNDWQNNHEYDFLSYIPEQETTIRDLCKKIVNEINSIPQNCNTYGVIHGDIWLDNVLVTKEKKLTLIDFQDCEKHYYMFDLAVPLYSALEFSFVGGRNIKEYSYAIKESLFEGYASECTISAELTNTLPLFLKLKELFEYRAMHRYWEKKNLSEEQVRIMNLYRIRIENQFSLF
ncbi:protein kinase [Bacillus sp. HMF5848]|uniref:phosphotransferase enzyme family protein n=1 Tax=Bacillus sp. HMF5848 TaxID=2495421 RepID=UPI000F7900B2|nr:phosphotransferase [Bacillus sp. HMF5848]RSK27734.1 protein kinase [Bacillus sp. HMF5848]